MDNKKLFSLFILIIIVAGILMLGVKYAAMAVELKKYQAKVAAYQMNDKVLNFTKLFIVKVINSKREVSFDDRVQLETAVRDINNPEIMAVWQKFVDSKNEAEVQDGVRNLLEILVNNIRVGG